MGIIIQKDVKIGVHLIVMVILMLKYVYLNVMEIIHSKTHKLQCVWLFYCHLQQLIQQIQLQIHHQTQIQQQTLPQFKPPTQQIHKQQTQQQS